MYFTEISVLKVLSEQEAIVEFFKTHHEAQETQGEVGSFLTLPEP